MYINKQLTQMSFISNNVSQKSNQTWLQAYHIALTKADDSEKQRESRYNYTHDSQIYPDYLDYKEEWEFATDEMITDVQKSYIYRMASTQSKILCECGNTHQLALYNSENSEHKTLVDDPFTTTWSTCWFRTISERFKVVRQLLTDGAAEIPDIITKNLTEILHWKVAKTGRTPTLLPYDTYKEVWWDYDVKGGSTELSLHVVSLMRQEARALVARKSDQIRSPDVERYFFSTEEIIEDHGFHSFFKANRQHINEILKITNRLRREVGYYSSNLKVKDVETVMNKCERCKKKTMVTSNSPFAIYCAPPGAGKTTALQKELLVGFDTDWVGIGPNWRDYSWFLRHEIPIITNQIHLFRDSGVKIQVFLKRAIRKDAKGRPMADYDRWKYITTDNKHQYVTHMLDDGEFVSNRVIDATALAHMLNVNIALMLNGQAIWDDEGERSYLNDFGRRMRNLAIGRVKVFNLQH